MYKRQGGWCAAWHGGAAGAAPLYALAHRAAVRGEGRAAAQVLVWHRPGAPPEEKLRAVWHACLLRHRWNGASAPPAGAEADRLHALAHASWPAALSALRRSGWDTALVYLDGDGGSLEPGGLGVT